MLKRNLITVCAVVALQLSLTSCSGSQPDQPTQEDQSALSLSAASDQVYNCLTERGWDVKITWDGGIEASSQSIPAEQESKYSDDSSECWGAIDNAVAAMTPEEIGNVYEQELITRDCLVDQGYTVETPPSKQQFVDSFQSDRWSAYGGSDISPSADDDAWRTVNETCRQPAWSLGVDS